MRPVREILLIREIPGRREPAGAHGCDRRRCVERFDAHAGIERQATDRPRVLDEDAEVVVHVGFADDRRVIDRDRRRLVARVVRDEVAVAQGDRIVGTS